MFLNKLKIDENKIYKIKFTYCTCIFLLIWFRKMPIHFETELKKGRRGAVGTPMISGVPSGTPLTKQRLQVRRKNCDRSPKGEGSNF